MIDSAADGRDTVLESVSSPTNSVNVSPSTMMSPLSASKAGAIKDPAPASITLSNVAGRPEVTYTIL